MDKEISPRTRTTFLIHFIISAVFGVVLWLIPGRALTLVGWVEEMVQLPESELSVPGETFVDAFITRLLGAALLALGYASFRGWRAARWDQVVNLVHLEAAFCILGTVAFFATLVLWDRAMPLFGWVCMVILVAFALAWGLALRKGE